MDDDHGLMKPFFVPMTFSGEKQKIKFTVVHERRIGRSLSNSVHTYMACPNLQKFSCHKPALHCTD